MFTSVILAEWSWETLFNNSETVAIMGGCGMIVLVVAVPLLIQNWYRIVRMRADTELKQSMIERGMSPADIERVLAAKTPEK